MFLRLHTAVNHRNVPLTEIVNAIVNNRLVSNGEIIFSFTRKTIPTRKKIEK